MARGWNEVRPIDELDRFLQTKGLADEGRSVHGLELKDRPIQQFCQGRDHALFFRPASSLGASQQRIRVVKPIDRILLA